MNSSSANSKNISKNNQKLDLKPVHALKKDLKNLAVKAIVIITGAWIILYVFEIFVAPIIGLQHSHVQIVRSVITIAIAFVIITTTRRILKNFLDRIERQFSTGVSFFLILFVSLITGILVLYQWNVDPQEILVGGGVATVVLGIGSSTIIGNILSGGLMLATFPARIGDSIFIANDNVRGKIDEITMLYTKVVTDQGAQYIVPNSAIIQGNVRIVKEKSISEQLPFADGDYIELTDSTNKYVGVVVKINPTFTTLLADDGKKEVMVVNQMILNGKFIITKNKKSS